jgi:tungstate transport system ATP-binding protein
MRTALLEIASLRKRFGERVLFDGANLVLQAGHGYVLSGANGSGKTTLLRIIAGLEPAEWADFRFRGVVTGGATIPEVWRRDMVYVHQQPYLFHTSVEKNLEYGLARRGEAAAQRKARVREALAWAGLVDRCNVPPQKLSGGEAQRAALARAKLLNPALLLLDEPTANLDGESRKKVLELVTALCIDNHTVLIASHDPEIRRLAILDRLTVSDRRIHADEG